MAEYPGKECSLNIQFRSVSCLVAGLWFASDRHLAGVSLDYTEIKPAICSGLCYFSGYGAIGF